MCKTASTPASYALLYFVPSFCTTPEERLLLKDKKIKSKESSLLLSSYRFRCHLKPGSHPPLFAGIKVTTFFSKGCLIRQSAVVAGPCGCCQACLCSTASAGEIYPVCFGTVATCFSFCARYAPSLPRKKNNIFTEGEEEEKALRRGIPAPLPGRIFHWQIQYITHLVFLYLHCSEGASTPLFMWTLIRTVTPAVWLYSTSTKCSCTYTPCSEISGKTVALEVITLLCVSVSLQECDSECVSGGFTHAYKLWMTTCMWEAVLTLVSLHVHSCSHRTSLYIYDRYMYSE